MTGVVGVWLLIVAIVVALDVGPGWVGEKLDICHLEHSKAVKPEGGRHRAKR